MSHALTETAASADFVTPLTVPDNGDDFTAACAIVVAIAQSIANREQWLKAWTTTSPKVVVALNAIYNGSSRFSASGFGPLYYTQTSIASAGTLGFNVPPLPAGRKILNVTARWQNEAAAGLPSGAQMPKIVLKKYNRTAGINFYTAGVVDIATGTDAAATLGAYQVLHNFSLTCSETITEDSLYWVEVQGETLQTGSTLAAIYLTLGL